MDSRKVRGQVAVSAVKWTQIDLDRSVLGTRYFAIFIDEEVLCEISKFDDDTKIASQVKTLYDIRSMHFRQISCLGK